MMTMKVIVTIIVRLLMINKKTYTQDRLDTLMQLQNSHYVISQQNNTQNLLSIFGVRIDKFEIYFLA